MPNSAIRDLVQQAANYLPAQGPITSFVHHNTLHAFEHLPFEQAVEEAARLYGTQPYLTEERYRSELECGAIRPEDLTIVLQDELGSNADATIAGLVRRIDLWTAMLANPIHAASDTEVLWSVETGSAVRAFRRRSSPLIREQLLADTRRWVMRELRGDREASKRLRFLAADALARWGEPRIEYWTTSVWEAVTLRLLWRVCREGVKSQPHVPAQAAPSTRLRDDLTSVTGVDPDELVHSILIRFCAAFADQGMAAWHIPNRSNGFMQCFFSLYARRLHSAATWLRPLRKEISRLQRDACTPDQLIEESLEALGVPFIERGAFVSASLLALRGWAGMLWQLETRRDWVKQPVPEGTLVEFLAVRLLLDRLAAEHVARRHLGWTNPIRDLGPSLIPHGLYGRSGTESPTYRSVDQTANVLLTLAQPLGWSPHRLSELTSDQWGELISEVGSFSGIVRRRVLHRAYERRYRIRALDAIVSHGNRERWDAERPSTQVFCCLDEREESLRRHIEEIDPNSETFGTAGFFGVAMLYRGSDDPHDVPLCPASIRPRHRVCEVVADDDRASFARGAYWTRLFALAEHRAAAGSRGFLRGIPLALLGSVAAIPLVTQVLFPRLSSRFRNKARRMMTLPVSTDLKIERNPGDVEDADGIFEGFTSAEMALIVGGLLREIGLTQEFARLVVVIGHGSSSMNNPHEAAHDCGACSGGRGGPNARAFAAMANHSDVRTLLAQSDLTIPTDTVFVGAYHNTCDDCISYFDTSRVPTTHSDEFLRARQVIDEASVRNAHERCRRFRSASLLISPDAAKRHSEGRAEDLAQPRPEFGHATNAICLVGRRSRSRGLFLDRRAFLASYDPESDADDPSSPILTRVLQAAVPICAGINLEYYFSYVDSTGWGCGTKLPHNITSLVGVMDGFASDLRTGLPWQMVEIHDPVRLTVVVETTPERLTDIFRKNEAIGRLARNEWIRVATLSPDSSCLHVLEDGEFRAYSPEVSDLPEPGSSVAWYGCLREHLEFASVRTESTTGIAGVSAR